MLCICCGLVESKKIVDLLLIVVDLLWICCGFAVQLVIQQIHNKSNKWSLSYITAIADVEQFQALPMVSLSATIELIKAAAANDEQYQYAGRSPSDGRRKPPTCRRS
jgi:hypothetical protein